MANAAATIAARRRVSPVGAGMALAGAAGYGTVGILMVLAIRTGLTVTSALAWRFSLAALVLLPFAAPRLRSVPRETIFAALALGAVAFTLQAYCYMAAVERIGAGPTALLLYIYPGLVVLIDWFVAKRRPSRLQGIVLGFSTLGCALTVQAPSGPMSPEGIAFGIVPAFVYATYLMLGSRVTRTAGPLVTSLGVSAGAAVSFWILAVAGHAPLVPPSLESWWTVVGLALVATVLPMAAVFGALTRLGPTDTALLSTAEPLFACGLAAVVLGETLGPLQLVGGAMVIVGAGLLAVRR